MEEKELITPQQAADLKGVPRQTIYSAIRRGALPSQQVLGRTALRRDDVDAYEPGSYGGVERAKKRRGPGRKKQSE